MKKCVFILGMHRSGTSALTGALEHMGVNLGADLLPPAADNTKGFFEDSKVVSLNERIFSELNTSFDDPRYELELAVDMVDRYAKDASDILNDEYSYSKIFAIKDPRLCLTFPVWEKAGKNQGVDIQIIIPYRNPFEVAQSLKKRNDFSIEKGLLIWLKHFFHAELYSRKYPRLFVRFDCLVERTTDTARNLKDFLDKDGDTLVVSDELDTFIDKKLKHNNLSGRNVGEHVPDFLRRIIDAVEADALEQIDFDLIREQYKSAYSMFHSPDVISYTKLSKHLCSQRDDALRKMQENSVAFQKAKSDAVKLQCSLDSATQEVDVLRLQLNEAIEDISTIKENNVTRDKCTDDLRHELEAAQSQNANLMQQQASACAEKEVLGAQLDKAVAEFAVMKEEKEALVKRSDDLQRELEAAQSQNVNLLQQQASACAEKEALGEQLDRAVADFSVMKEEKGTLVKRSDDLQHELVAAQSQNESLTQEVNSLRELIDQVVADLAELKESKCWIYTKPIREFQKAIKG